jgi:hypothetical protein
MKKATQLIWIAGGVVFDHYLNKTTLIYFTIKSSLLINNTIVNYANKALKIITLEK